MAKKEVFPYGISQWAPFRDKKACERVRGIKKEELCQHPNPKVKIEIVDDKYFAFYSIYDIFFRIKDAMEANRRLVLILPQPHPLYAKVAFLINRFRVDCKKLYTFNMDEWADEDGNPAPETYENGFMYAQLKNFYSQVDEKLRPPRENMQGLTKKNLKDYGRMIADLGGADVCYGGIGWSGHIAFIDPRTPEFETDDLEEFKAMGPRIVTLNPITICQSSLDADFGMSGDWSWIPPKAATIGPREIVSARLRSSWNCFTLSSTNISWQRFTVRLALHGPITPKVPASILQIGPSEIHISDTVAGNIEVNRKVTWYN
jgi:6-phosphogluconolactonase/glucosamine-6-phosphate isomerase/deaminase